jgi:hypothetical protein
MIPNSDEPPGLRQRARERIRSGKLPNHTPISTWGGPSNGARCPVCDSDLRRGEWELAFEVESPGGTDGKTYQMHVSCYIAWESEVLEGSASEGCSEPIDSCLGSDDLYESETSTGRSR